MTTPILVIVTGAPGTGKTTLGRRLAADLGLPYLSKDGLKEILMEAFPRDDRDLRDWSRPLGATSMRLLVHVLDALLAAGTGAVAESNFLRDLSGHEFRTLGERHPFRPIQVVCRCAPEVLRARLAARAVSGERHPGHDDLAIIGPVMAALARGDHEPMDLGGGLIEVDTTSFELLDTDAVLATVRRMMGRDT